MTATHSVRDIIKPRHPIRSSHYCLRSCFRTSTIFFHESSPSLPITATHQFFSVITPLTFYVSIDSTPQFLETSIGSALGGARRSPQQQQHLYRCCSLYDPIASCENAPLRKFCGLCSSIHTYPDDQKLAQWQLQCDL
jgi:hypothetical protein